ncbi:choline/carnitine O-acyltransferase [Microvirga brassicacearum]|uniref:Choline/carnitine O-acyltransferase n=1 Tax=Microvirga brassicacearum TaxID=2580413 RepID=A0A5N3PHC2_9HYPH|nr:choline/carnitine O-acyltransferase [Microvirga brassicacearum]KAB0269083.1 choline/carnitine O-acyltransferase [Microvirga brassicacearum]
MMPFSFTWELNLVALVTLVGSAVAVLRFWLTASQKADLAIRSAADAMESARQAHEKVALLQAAINAHQLSQAERLVSREVLREVEGRLAGAIENLGDRLDGLVKELIKQSRVS